MENGKSKTVQLIQKGFTLIELLVVISVLGILSTASIVSFVTYNENQTLANAVKDITQMILNAKSRAQSQIKPPGCTESLAGYEVTVCSVTSECTESGGNYQMVAVCGDARILVDPRSSDAPKKLPRNITFDPAISPPMNIFFPVLGGKVTGTGGITLSGYGQERNIIIDASGNVF